MDGPGNILQRLLARILDIERNPVARVVQDCLRDTDAAGICERLKSRRDVHTVPKDVMRFDDHVAHIDAHTESDAPILYIVACKLLDAGLELQRGSNRLDCTRKLRQEPVASVL